MPAQNGTRSFKLVVTGPFDFNGYREMCGALHAKSEVRHTFYDKGGTTMSAAATFMVHTDHEAVLLEGVLKAVTGVHQVMTESNDAN